MSKRYKYYVFARPRGSSGSWACVDATVSYDGAENIARTKREQGGHWDTREFLVSDLRHPSPAEPPLIP